MRPVAMWFQLGGFTADILGARVVACFLEAERVECAHQAIAWLVPGPLRHGAGRATCNPSEFAAKSVEQQPRKVRHEVVRISHQQSVDDADRGIAMPEHSMAERLGMHTLAVVHGDCARFGKRCLRAFDQHGIVGPVEDPCFADVRHGELRCRLDGLIEKPERVAIGKHSRAHGVIEELRGFGRRTGNLVPLRILHRDYPCLQSAGRPASFIKLRQESIAAREVSWLPGPHRQDIQMESTMLERPLTMAIATTGLTAPLKQGAIDLGQLKLTQIAIEPITTAMRRMVRDLEFDICEMAMTTYLCARAHGKPITAIPVFVTRNFHHWAAFTTDAAGIRIPKDLEGRRVAVNRGYTVTTGVWVRGILQSEYGVDLRKITWVPTDDEHVSEFVYPGNVDLSCRGQSAADLLLSGDCVAAIGDVKSPSRAIRPLISNAREVGFDYFRRTGVYPVNHTITIADNVLAAHPWLAREMYAAFVRSRDVYYASLRDGTANAAYDAGPREIQRALGIEPFPYGIDANRRALETIAAFAVDQGILANPTRIEALFADVA